MSYAFATALGIGLLMLPAALLLTVRQFPETKRAIGYWILEAILVGVWGFCGLAVGLFVEILVSVVFPMARLAPSPLVLIFGQAGIALGIAVVVIRYRNRERDR
jgi:hypothetical protein